MSDTTGDRLKRFETFRSSMNQRILEEDNLVVKRFFSLDSQTYRPGALDSRTKELMGLAASMVLRCDDCIAYHVIQCRREGLNRQELFEAFGVSLVVGGSIVIPHLRRAVSLLDELEAEDGDDSQARDASLDGPGPSEAGESSEN